MDNLDDSENNAKVSDSAYSNSCSNSQSRRSHSSKSTNSGSHSSRSSGYGGKPATFSDNNGQQIEKPKKEKDGKQKKPGNLESTSEITKEVEEQPADPEPVVDTVQEETTNVESTPAPQQTKAEKVTETLKKNTPENPSCSNEVNACTSMQLPNATTCIAGRSPCSNADGFSCVISIHDGVVMYTTSSLTATLGFPKDMWIGRSFIDFVHTKDRNTFASHITTGLTDPKNLNVPSSQNSVCTMVCRLRKYRSLSNGYGVKERNVAFMPFLIKLSFKNISGEGGKVTYLVIQATPFYSAFKVPNELVVKAIPFVLRHAANGNMEYIDPESVPYLGYLPQDLVGKNALQLYHADDLPYLRQVYETIVKEGGVPTTKPYRMMTQNWDFIKVETEWSSFINPWSKKLEFVIGKHRIIEGPTNPDVFEATKNEKSQKMSDEEAKKAQSLRDSIIRTMNEVLTKPAEVAKQQMSKRCQDLASFMESVMEEQPKAVDELQVDIQDPDNYYERDSVMLGGISPHHEYNDSKSSVETPLSYNQLNYNDTLQRYFDSHQPYSYVDYNTVTGQNILGIKTMKRINGNNNTSGAQTSGVSEGISSGESGTGSNVGNSPAVPPAGEPALRLTENIINKHNTVMEKELFKTHRETRSNGKGDRKKTKNENRQKKEEHLARCNATFQPTSLPNPIDMHTHGVKRSSKPAEQETATHKHHCPTPRQSKKIQSTNAVVNAAPESTLPATIASSAGQWTDSSGNAMNALFLGLSFPQPISIMGAMPGMIPMYYTSTATPVPVIPGGNSTMLTNAIQTNNMSCGIPNAGISNIDSPQFQQQLQCMMYSQAVYGSPFMYSPINPQIAYPQPLQPTGNQSLGLTTSSYQEACNQITSSQMKTKTNDSRDNWSKEQLFPPRGDGSVETSATLLWRYKQLSNQTDHSKTNQGSSGSNFSTSVTCNRDGANSDSLGTARMDLCSSGTRSLPSTEVNPDSTPSCDGKKGSLEETLDRTDGQSSCSSFYSSFFKTESGSAEESNTDPKKKERGMATTNTYYEPPTEKTFCRRGANPPWLEQVNMTSNLIYKYQIKTRSLDEILKADRLKIEKMHQPMMVNDQLGQLYLDMQLEGVAANLTLDEGIASSCSSDDENNESTSKNGCRRYDYSNVVMFYEEDAPLPPTPASSPPPPTVVEVPASTSAI